MALSIPICRILEHEGIQPHHGRVYRSPFREDKDPSFHIYPDSNRWVDYGLIETHRGGDGINLIQKLKGFTFKEAMDYLLEMDGGSPSQHLPHPQQLQVTRGRRFNVHRIDLVCKLVSSSLISYLISRHIPLGIAMKYCREIHYTHVPTNRRYFGIGFPNDLGGWVVRTAPSPRYPNGTKLDVSAYCISTISKDKGKVAKEAYVFEGFMDFLSWVALFGEPDKDVIVLNSVENVGAMSHLSSAGTEVIHAFLDNDIPGKGALTYLTINSGCRVIDRSELYRNEGLKDLNDYLKVHYRDGKRLQR